MNMRILALTVSSSLLILSHNSRGKFCINLVQCGRMVYSRLLYNIKYPLLCLSLIVHLTTVITLIPINLRNCLSHSFSISVSVSYPILISHTITLSHPHRLGEAVSDLVSITVDLTKMIYGALEVNKLCQQSQAQMSHHEGGLLGQIPCHHFDHIFLSSVQKITMSYYTGLIKEVLA